MVAAGEPPRTAAPAADPAGGGEGGELAWADQMSFKDARQAALEEFERRYFERLLRRVDGNISEAARVAGLDRSNLRRALGRLGMREPGRD
jgi:DNA-binding NtrC family response regulator